MNRHQQEAKKYLSQAFGLNQRIESKLGQIEDLHDLATKATVTYSDMPKSPNRDGSRMEDAIIKIIDLENEINQDMMKLVELKKDIICRIKAVVSIGAYKIGTMIKVSEELLNDSIFDLENYISTEFARRIGAKEEEAFFTGDGSGKPTGILAAAGGAEVGVTAAAATALTADEVIDLFYSLKSPYRKNAFWVLNDSTVKAIRKLKDGQGQYLWQPSLAAGMPDTILGRPVKTSAFMPAVAAGAKTVAFGDFRYYWIADRQGRSFKKLSELYAATGQVGFLGSQRVDGRLILPEAVKVLKQKAS